MKNTILFTILAVICSSAAFAATQQDEATRRRRVGQAEYYVREFENEVARQKGGEKMVWHSKKTALEKVQALKQEWPDDPDVESLYLRTKVALMKSKGDYTEVQPEWLAYLHNEENLRKLIGELGEKEWAAFIEQHKTNMLEKSYPTPDSAQITIDELRGKYVILDDVEYPQHQFYGATGEYIHCGKPSSGYWFVNIATRDWLGPYEAVKRYRRNVDSGMTEVKKWTLLGEISGITAENPRPSEDGVGNLEFGWIIKPIALFVPGHVMAVYDSSAQSSGRFIGEEKVDEIKDGWYTVKSVPDDVTPERLMEIFMTAIKEKNFKLYRECINPDRFGGEYGNDNVTYHWDLHQERFHGEYIHATFDKATITTIKGFDDDNDLENFFLDDDQRSTIKKFSGDKIEEATVESRAIDKNGKQLGSPHPHKLRRVNGGRWYVEDYAPRF
ncbi:MAG: hypothetical protein IJQ34_10390 [Kiritimatiellae bacterium]|nr:hypothetical protein [Kiritimatiellia bacterium]